MLLQAADFGHPIAQHKLSVAYASGLYSNLVPVDQGRSILLQKFSASAGNPEAHMSLGYRYLRGLGVRKSCEKALRFYEYAANYAASDLEYRGYGIFADKSHLGSN